MEWTVLADTDFEHWLLQQDASVRVAIIAHIQLLKQFGPTLGRPRVDTLKGSKLANLKELRVQQRGDPWRILFIFDSKRQAILLVGGNKKGNERWYMEAIPLAEKRYQQYLEDMEQANGKKL